MKKLTCLKLGVLNNFDSKEFVMPALNKGQKVVRAYSVTDGGKVSFKLTKSKETVLAFEKTDPVLTIIAVELNKAVMSE